VAGLQYGEASQGQQLVLPAAGLQKGEASQGQQLAPVAGLQKGEGLQGQQLLPVQKGEGSHRDGVGGRGVGG